MFNLFVRKKIAARMRCQDGTDRGFTFLKKGTYAFKPLSDGYFEILQSEGESLYLMALIFNEKLSSGDIALLNESQAFI